MGRREEELGRTTKRAASRAGEVNNMELQRRDRGACALVTRAAYNYEAQAEQGSSHRSR